MNKTITALTLSAILFVLCSFADAQQPKKVSRIGFVPGSGDSNNPGSSVEAFRQGLRDLGYIEGKNIQIESRSWRERWTASQASWPNSCDSRSMCLSLYLY